MYVSELLNVTADHAELCMSDGNDTVLYQGKADRCPSDLFDRTVTGLFVTKATVHIQVDNTETNGNSDD